MTGPRNPPITDEMMLEQMEPGIRYSVKRLAVRLQCREERVRLKLVKMFEAGQVSRERKGSNDNGTPSLQYFVDGESIAGGAFEMATPFIGVNLTGELVGYDAALNARAALCMTLRRVA